MEVGLVPEKVIRDIQECVYELRKDFQDRIPINDDNTNLHRFCYKLEYLLQNGMKEHYTLLGGKKDYWDYFCRCLASTRGGIHDGLKFVKSVPELKTSLGCGRAFIRFCLMHQCLADTLQCCFMNKKITDNWYYENSTLTQKSQLSALLAILYELNDVQFDLSPQGHDLDVSWPTFARKVFGMSHMWQIPNRSISVSSLVSCTSQNDYGTPQCYNDSTDINETEELKAEIASIQKNLEELQLQLRQAEEKEQQLSILSDEKETQLIYVKNLLEEERKEHRIHVDNMEESISNLQQKWQLEKEELVEKLNQLVKNSSMYLNKIQELTTDCENKEKNYISECEKLQEKLLNLESEKTALISQSSYWETELINHKELLSHSAEHVKELEGIVSKINEENEALKGKIEDQIKANEVPVDITSTKMYRELLHKFKLNESDLFTARVELKHVKRNINKAEELNQITGKLADTLEVENSKLRSQLSDVENSISHFKERFENCQRLNDELQDDLSKIQRQLENVIENKNKVEWELKLAKKFPRELITMMEKTIESSQLDSSEIDKLCKSENIDSTLREKIYTVLQLLVNSFNSSNSCTVDQQNVNSFVNINASMSNICRNQTVAVEELQKELSGCLQETLKLNCQICVVRDMLHLYECKNITQSVNECDLVNETEVVAEDSNFNLDNEPTASACSVNNSLDAMNNNVLKLTKLTAKTHKLCYDLEAFRNLNHKLIAKVQEQERKLSGITQELESTQKLVSSLKYEHNKLRTAEAITRYELKEKRKLLTRLRTQLETTREDWNRMRRNCSDSEAEWQSLRDEFAKRHKQPSEESGFIDDKSALDSETNNNISEITRDTRDFVPASSPVSESSQHDDSQMTDCSVHLSSSCEGAEGSIIEEVREDSGERQKTRLEILEQQCQSLYQSLVQSASKSDHLEQRVRSLLRSPNLSDSVKLGEASTSVLPEPHSVEESQLNSHDDNSVECTCSETDQVLDEIPQDTADVLDQPTEEFEDSELTSSHFCGVSNVNLRNEYYLSDETSDEDNSVEQECVQNIHTLRRKALNNFVTKFRNERMQHESQEADLRSEIELLRTRNKTLEREMEKIKDEKSDLIAKEMDFRKRSEYIFRKERENFNTQVTDIDARNSTLEKKVIELEENLQEARNKIKELEKSHQQAIEELNKVQQSRDEEAESFKFQLSTECLKYERALKHYKEQQSGIADMKRQINDQERLIVALQETLLDIKEEREFEKQQQKRKVDELQLLLATRDEECSRMNEDFKKIVMELDQEKKLSEKRDLELTKIKSENDQLKTAQLQLLGDNEKLKKTVIKLIREKDVLWKKSEKLSYQQQIQITDRWMEDTEATSCLGCKVAFSFTVRKHHCRLCGRIFCHNCANNWLLTTSSRREARVCNECYIQHIEMQAEAKNVCSVPNITEDSDDENGQEIPITTTDHPITQLASSSDSSIDPESTSPLSNNVSFSLPASGHERLATLDSTVLPIYGSVPDLPSFSASRRCSHDYRLMNENKKSNVFQGQASNNTTADQASTARPFHEEFDLISDEEIALSLSSSNPYIQIAKPGRRTESRLHTTITRNASAIETAGTSGVRGELWVNAGTQYGIPVVCDITDHVLSWEFSSEPQIIAFSVVYKKSKSNIYNKLEMEPLLHTTHVNSSQNSIKGHVIMKKPGIYMLVFDNRFSRICANKVKYLLIIKSAEECQENINI